MGRKLDQPSREVCDIVDNRDGRSCARCGKSLYSVVGARHHRKLRSQASKTEKHTVSNLIRTCHEWIHANPMLAYEHGYLVHSYADPREVPIDHVKWGTCYLWNDGTVATIPETLAVMGGARIEHCLCGPVTVYEDGTWELSEET